MFTRMTSRTPDGRHALREKHRAHIVTAAWELAVQRGPRGFTIDQVATRAGVSRRTVFNHFPTFDLLLVAVGDTVLKEVVDQLVLDITHNIATADLAREDNHGYQVTVFDAVCAATQSARLPRAIATMTHLFGTTDGSATRGHEVSQAAFHNVGQRVLGCVVREAPLVDTTAAEIVITFLMSGLGVIARRWVDETQAALDAQSRTLWHEHLTKLLEQMRSGYVAVPFQGTA